MTVNFVLGIKNCKEDFGIGVGVISKCKATYRESYPGSFCGPMFQMALLDMKEKMVDEALTFQALITRPPLDVKAKIEAKTDNV